MVILTEAGFGACGRDADGFRVQTASPDIIAVAFRHAPGTRCCQAGDPDAKAMLAKYADAIRDAGRDVTWSRPPAFPVLAVAARAAADVTAAPAPERDKTR